MFGIVTGLPSEARIWGSANDNVIVACCGMGMAAAERATQLLIEQGATALISSGIAGGLAPMATVGALVIADRVLDDNGNILDCDYKLSTFWRDSLPTALAGDILTTATVIATVADKQKLLQRYSAIAVDMESFAVAQVAHQKGLPFAVVRVVADPYNQAIPGALLDGLREDGTLEVSKIMRALASSPILIKETYNIARQSRIAHRALTKVVSAIIRTNADNTINSWLSPT